MDLSALIEAIAQPSTYSFPVPEVEVRQTHISVVALAGPWVFKLKKPVQLGFLDFSTLEKRRHFCEEEVRLNRRLAPSVYVGVVPLTCQNGGLRFEGLGEPVEYAVKMVRLPQAATLERRLERAEVSEAQLQALAQKLARFHADAEANEAISAFGCFAVVAGNVRENFQQTAGQVGKTVHQAVFHRVRDRTEQSLRQLQPLIEARAAAGKPRDTHGDLHVDHVYLFPERPPPEDLVVIDCIEFNERFRHADPIADLAFLVMDLKFHGYRDQARLFAETYFAASGDAEGRSLLPFYTAYRAVIRAKVEGMEAAEAEVPEAERAAAITRAEAHWLLALGELEEPNRRPCLVLVAGLPGTGKSTLARALGERMGLEVIRSDVVRKELSGSPEQDIYSAAWNQFTYAECLRRADTLLMQGRRVLVDANFRLETQRRLFLDLAKKRAVPGVMLVCRADEAVVRARLAGRQADDSDADWTVYQQLQTAWEAPDESVRATLHEIEAGGSREETYRQALAILGRLEFILPSAENWTAA